MKKTIYLILFVLLASMLAVGCTGSSREKTASSGVDQDTSWKESVQKNSALLQTDFENVGTALSDTNNPDYTTLSTTGQNMVDDSQKALTENKQSNVSSKYQDAQKEWVLALEDSNSAGKYLIMVANDGKSGNMNIENVNNVTSFSNSATAHLKRTATLTQIADGTA